jgi:hypothetical protein
MLPSKQTPECDAAGIALISEQTQQHHTVEDFLSHELINEGVVGIGFGSGR